MTTDQKSNEPTTTAAAPAYENNPFNVAIKGLELFFKFAKTIAIITIIFSAVSFISNSAQSVSDFGQSESQARIANDPTLTGRYDEVQNRFDALSPAEVLILLAVIVAVFAVIVFIATVISGMLDYTTARLSKRQPVTISEAFKATTKRFFPYLWLRILVTIKVLLWSLLLIVPGIIMAVRYSLSGVSFFDKNIGANAATKDSSKLVKGAWITTSGSMVLFNIITLGVMSATLKPGTSAMLYRQFDDYEKAGVKKPAAHILSWLTLLIPIIVIVLLIFLIFAVVAFLAGTNTLAP